MAERTYYVICDDNCKFEGMTKEQILAAIEQAVSTGEIKDVDAGFITKIKEMNANKQLKFWVGTTAEFNAITTKDANTLYILSDDDSADSWDEIADTLNKIVAGTVKVGAATIADYASSDTSKGTIEERLTNLGFKEGTVTVTPDGTPEYGDAMSGSSLKRQGNYVIGYIQNASFMKANVNVFSVPDWAKPKNEVTMNYVRAMSMTTTGFIYETIKVTLTVDGYIKADKSPIAPGDIYFGYEAKPLQVRR